MRQNKSLPPSKRAKALAALPVINAHNVGAISRVCKDEKKGTVEFVSKYHPIGLIDDFMRNKESNSCKVSQHGKVRTVSEQSARKKIDFLRRQQGALINTNTHFDEQNLDNVFTTAAKLNDVISMSMFSRAGTYQEMAFSQQMSQNWMKTIEVDNNL